MTAVSTARMTVSSKTDLRFPIPGQAGHGSQIIHDVSYNNRQQTLPSVSSLSGYDFSLYTTLFLFATVVAFTSKIIAELDPNCKT